MSQESKKKRKKIPRFPGCDDPGEVTLFLLKQSGNIFVDVGANIGFYTIGLAKNWKKIYSFEPFSNTAKILKSLVEKKKLRNVEVRIKALSNQEGEKTFYLSPRGDKCHSLLPVGEKRIPILCSTLSKEFPETKIDLVKVDVEGSEFEVLEGAEEIIENIEAWIIEVHDLEEICGRYVKIEETFQERKRAIEEYLRELGYETEWISNKVIYGRRKRNVYA